MLASVVVWPDRASRTYAAIRSTTTWAAFSDAAGIGAAPGSADAFGDFCKRLEAQGLSVAELADWSDLAIRFSFSGISDLTGRDAEA